MQLDADAQLTLERMAPTTPGPLGVGLGTTDHDVPFHCSMRVPVGFPLPRRDHGADGPAVGAVDAGGVEESTALPSPATASGRASTSCRSRPPRVGWATTDCRRRGSPR